MTTPLLDGQIQAALQDLISWERNGDALQREFKFGSFREAISFIVRIAFSAEAADHHPELRNLYSTVRVRLSTHDAGDRITQKDVDLAAEISAVAWVA